MKFNFITKRMKYFNAFMSLIRTSLFAILVPTSIEAFRNEKILDNVLDDELQVNQENFMYKSDYPTYETLKKSHKELSEEITIESAVLLKNDSCLPLKNASKLTLFSRNSVDLIYGGTGSNAINLNKKLSLKGSLEESGFIINPVIYEHYKSSNKERVDLNIDNPNYDYLSIAEDNEGLFNSGYLTNSFLKYNDCGVIVISRIGGEGYDLPTSNFDKVNGNYKGENGYLTIQKEELELIKKVKRYFSKTLVLLNTSSGLDISPLVKGESEVNGILWIGYPGEYGLNGISKLIKGEANPSGKLPHTYIKDISSYPANQNFDDFTFKNKKPLGEYDSRYNYLIYQEGIYVGYRYYETLYESSVLNSFNYNYSNDVIFPFGYGLSYTSFNKELIGVDFNEETSSYSLYIKVKNVGKKEGKDVIQIYNQNEYTTFDQEHSIEKASVNLVAFKKTKTLKPGESDIVVIDITLEDLKNYDSNFFKTYFLGKGEYYLTLANNAHEAINNILSIKLNQKIEDEFSKVNTKNVYRFSLDKAMIFNKGKKQEITNKFDEVDINYFLDNKINYLSRRDLSSTFPKPLKDISLTPEMENELNKKAEEKIEIIESVTTLSDSNIKLLDLLNKEYDDPNWNILLSKISNEDLANLVGKGGFGTSKINSIVYPGSKDSDGPSGISGNAYGGKSGTSFPSESLIAASWNEDLLIKLGQAIANEAIYFKTTGWYAPGINIQRSPYSGRNNEYYSEDPYLSGILGSNVIEGAYKKGIIAYPKHLLLNDQEKHRHGICIFANEQTIREIYLKPFELIIKNSHVQGIMTSFNRVGLKRSAANKNLLTDVIEEELGFNGILITDYTSGYEWMGVSDSINSGLNIFLTSSTDVYKNEILSRIKTSESFKLKIINSAHKILYIYLHSSAMNGYTKEMDSLKNSISTRKVSIIVLDTITLLIALTFIALFTVSLVKK